MAQLQREPKYTIVIAPSTERSWPFPDEVLLARDGTVLGILVDTNHLANHVIKRWTEIASPFRLQRQRSLGPTVNQTYNIEQICLTDYWQIVKQIVVRYVVDDTVVHGLLSKRFCNQVCGPSLYPKGTNGKVYHVLQPTKRKKPLS